VDNQRGGQDRWPLTWLWRDWTWLLSEQLRKGVDASCRDAQLAKRWADERGDKDVSDLCEYRVRLYAQYKAEFDQRDAAAREQYRCEYREWDARSRYAGLRNGVWADVLRWARSGELPPDWRTHLPGYLARIAAIVRDEMTADVDGLVLHEFATLAPQPWEPYAAGGDWRAALEAWYRDRLAVHDRQHRHHQERSAAPRPFRPPADTEFAALMACRQADTAALLVIGYERKRDRIEASYRAGLAAGGDDQDWTGWYRQRIIDTWDRRHDEIYGHGLCGIDRELHSLADPDWVAQMQTLPGYWHDTAAPD
jgi:hypothetical protein